MDSFLPSIVNTDSQLRIRMLGHIVENLEDGIVIEPFFQINLVKNLGFAATLALAQLQTGIKRRQVVHLLSLSRQVALNSLFKVHAVSQD